MALTRRQWLVGAGGGATLAGVVPAALASSASPTTLPSMNRMAAAWEADAGYQVGVLAAGAKRLHLMAALDVPTRAHGLLVEASGSLLSVARRPGDWLLRWTANGQAQQWHWIEPDRAFNGHVIASADGRHLYTTESDLETGQGLVGVRDVRSLEKIAEWRTHGMDPHELLLDTDGTLIVANGGIPALPETGRLKIGLERMDASVVRLDTRTGKLRGQWRLADARLSLRHIAWGQDARTGQHLLGIALQAEHADPSAKKNAPVLAVFDGKTLKTFAADLPLGGYGGDIAFANGCFAVSCPRANGVAWFRASGAAEPSASPAPGHWLGLAPLPEACALLPLAGQGHAAGTSADAIWAGGRDEAQAQAPGEGGSTEGQATAPRTLRAASTSLRLDNHWIHLPPAT